MRVGFVLRSAEIKPLVPKICAGIFSFTWNILVHLAPPPATSQPRTANEPDCKHTCSLFDEACPFLLPSPHSSGLTHAGEQLHMYVGDRRKSFLFMDVVLLLPSTHSSGLTHMQVINRWYIDEIRQLILPGCGLGFFLWWCLGFFYGGVWGHVDNSCLRGDKWSTIFCASSLVLFFLLLLYSWVCFSYHARSSGLTRTTTRLTCAFFGIFFGSFLVFFLHRSASFHAISSTVQ